MIERNTCPIHQVSLRAVSQPISDVAPPEDYTFSTWFLHHAPLILGSALGMFASNVFLYALQSAGVGASRHVSFHALSSLPSRMQKLAIAAPRSILRTYAWTAQFSRHIYLLFLCALCQAVILPCLVGSQLLGWAGRAWFGALRVLSTAIRILFTVLFDVIVVDTGLHCAVILAAKAVTSQLRRTWYWTTDLHDAALEFVGCSQSTLPPLHSDRLDGQAECSSTAASTSRLNDSVIGTSRAFARPIPQPGPSRTKNWAIVANFVIAYKVEVARGETRFRVPISTTLHLRVALADQREKRSIGGTGFPGKADALRLSESNDVGNLLGRRDPGDGWSIQAGRDTLDSTLKNPQTEALEEQEERFRRLQTRSVPAPRVVRRNSGWASQHSASPLRSPSVTSPAFWCPPGAAAPEIKMETP